MESARTFLFVLFVFLSFLVYQQWQEANEPEPQVVAPIESSIADYAATPLTNDLEQVDDLSAEVAQSQSTALPPTDKQASVNQQPIKVVTDTLRLLISPAGGDFISAELLNHRQSLEKDSLPINLLENRKGRVYLLLSGLYGKDSPNFKGNIPNYLSSQTEYQLEDGQDSMQVDLVWTNNQGVEYTKRYTFYRGKYLVNVEFLVTNKSSQQVSNRMFTAIKRDTKPVEGIKSEGFGLQSYLGPAYSTSEEKYETYSFDDIQDADLSKETSGGWVAVLQHYFVTAWIPQSEDSVNRIDATNKKLGKAGLTQIRITQDWQEIQPGQTETLSAKLYLGPKIQSDLEEIDEHLDLTIDYGWLWWIAQPIFYLLIFLQKYMVNWGLAIIVLTIIIKTLLYPLARAQYRSFAKMRLLAPKLADMKERYGSDRQQFSMKMMELYKKEKVNPLGGCFPLLIQMPVFIALYWVLMESVEIRHQPFMLWINDLSVKDPYFVLPLLMGASMYLMQKMQPTSPTMDPMQQKIFQMMPVFMTVFFVFFPAGLVLYWLMNNLISIAQQLYITNQFNKEVAAKKK